MKKQSAVWLLASVLSVSSGICVGVTVAVRNAPGTAPLLDMVTTLEAAGPHPSLADHANPMKERADLADSLSKASKDDPIEARP
jgi:hypothetical protein